MWAALAATLGNLVSSKIGFWIMTALAGLGLAFGVQTLAVDPLLDAIKDEVANLPADALAWFRHLGFDVYITTVLSAYAAAATMNAVRMMRRPA